MAVGIYRCSWIFILVTRNLLSHSESRFTNNHALMSSINKMKGAKYVPIFKSQEELSALQVPDYIKVLI